MLALAFLAIILLGALLANTRLRLGNIERELGQLGDLVAIYREELSTPSRKKTRKPAVEPDTKAEAPQTAQQEPEKILVLARRQTEEPAEPAEYLTKEKPESWVSLNRISQMSFEDMIGGKLPIWIGGIALAFAGFFMVRYSIEQGLLGPGARVSLATIFGMLLVILSEFGAKLPKVGVGFAEDKRIAQSLAGAGIAVLYATLYMASELYGLIGVGTAFVLVVAVTALAFALSLRHGPPTAIMGVAGGFAAPWVANMGPDNMPTLLLYLGVFIAALFGLSIWRRWLWLLLLTTGGGAVWSFALILSANTGLPLLGLFITLMGAAAVLSALRISGGDGLMAKAAIYAPMSLALFQMAILLPEMNFTPVGWAFTGALGLLAVVLAWRDAKLLPLAGAAATITLMPIWSAWQEGAETFTTIAASMGYILLYAGTGQAWLWLKGKSKGWAALAILPAFFVYFTALWIGDLDLSDTGLGLLAFAAALPAALAGWHFAGEETPLRPISLLAAFVTGTLLLTALLFILPEQLVPLGLTLLALAMAAWAQLIKAVSVRRLAYVPMGIAVLTILGFAATAIGPMLATLAGEYPQYQSLPPVGRTAVQTLLPAAALLAAVLLAKIAPIFALGRTGRWAALLGGAAGVTIFLWLCSKQIFRIETVTDFAAHGFTERLLLTLALAGAGAAALWQGRDKDSGGWQSAGQLLLCGALARFVLFDLMLFNPLLLAQQLGPAPIANLGVLLCAGLSLAFWAASKWAGNLPGGVNGRLAALCASLGLAICATLVMVRQAVHGSVIAIAPVGTSENYLYSVALLALALAWLARGILTSARNLRLAGLALLTGVTLKVFLVDAAALEGILRILSFLGLGIALIGIGWAYGRLMRGNQEPRAE